MSGTPPLSAETAALRTYPHNSGPLIPDEVRALRTFVGPSHADSPGGPIAWVPWETWERILATLDATRSEPAGLDADLERLRAIEEAARPVEVLLARLNGQALNPGPDHLVAVTVEAWRDFITPLWQNLAAALLAPKVSEP